jgi:MOSC domain-containing protein YiiM
MRCPVTHHGRVGVVQSVNVGTPREAAWAEIGRTSIDKLPVARPVSVGLQGIEGDQVSDTRHHGGLDQAVYAYSREELDWWSDQLGDPLRDGEYGENLTTAAIDVDGAEIGERWRIGTVLLEVASVRTPCNDFKTWMGRGGHDNKAWVRRFAERARPGAYLRVLDPGVLAAGEPVDVVHRPGHGITVSMMFRALTLEPDLLPRLLEIERLAVKVRRRVELAATGR